MEIIINNNSVVLENSSNHSTFEIQKFIRFCFDYLKIKDVTPKIFILGNRTEKLTTFAYYSIEDKEVHVLGNTRHILDVFRSLAHELVHLQQDILGKLNDTEQTVENNDGVPIENEANAVAGVIMRIYGRDNKYLY